MVPGNVCPYDGGGTVCPAEWEMRRVYVVETTPNRKKIGEELYSKHLVYIDSEADVVVYHDMYDRRGELMVNFCNWLTYRDRPVPDAKVAIYPFKRVFQVNGTSTNVQNGMSSFCDLPTPGAPRTRMLVHQYGRGDTGRFHHRRGSQSRRWASRKQIRDSLRRRASAVKMRAFFFLWTVAPIRSVQRSSRRGRFHSLRRRRSVAQIQCKFGWLSLARSAESRS